MYKNNKYAASTLRDNTPGAPQTRALANNALAAQDDQHTANFTANQDRGPVSVGAVRLHARH